MMKTQRLVILSDTLKDRLKGTLKKNEMKFAPNAQRRTFAAFMLFVPMALFATAATFAQNVPVAPLVAAASPGAFAEIAASHPLQLPALTGEESAISSSAVEQNALPQDPGAHPVAPIYTKYIPSGWKAQPITAHDKFLIGLRDLYDPLNLAAVFASAGYEQLTNGEPNYGTDRGAFGERLGAAGIRETTQGFFTDSIFSPLLHEDPRYYVEGPDYSFFHRTLYAITRPLITRTDSGRSSINGALLLGYAASSGLTYAYYPEINQNFRDTASTFGGGIGGAALGYFVSEFSADVLQKLHLEKKP